MSKEQEVRAMAREICIATHSDGKCDCTDTLKRICEGSTLADCEALYNAGYRKTFTSDLASDTQKAFKEGYIKGVEEVKAEYEKPIDKFIKDREAQVVKEFAEKLKKQIANTMYCRDGYIDYDDTMDVIDELLKEYEK